MIDVKPNVIAELGLVPVVVPPWRADGWYNGSAVFRRNAGLLVFLSASTEADKRVWIHVSVSRRDRVPNYAERTAVQVFAPADEHFNLHPFCLHLWALADASVRPLPDFRFAGGGV